MKYTEAEIKRFVERLRAEAPPAHARGLVDGDCLVFTGAHDVGGYGRVQVRGRSMLAHVLWFEIVNGRAPRGMLLHGCDRRDCVSHTREGDAAENFADMTERGRAVPPPHPQCEAHPQAKLNRVELAAVMERLERGELTQEQAAKLLGIAQSRVSVIFNGKGWRCR